MCRLALFLFFCTSLIADIHEIHHIKELEKYLLGGELVIYDLDHTLIHLVQPFGNDHWFGHRYKEYQSKGLPKDEALHKTLFEWESIQRLSDVELVESYAGEQIRNLQEKGHKVMALTTRGLGMIQRTLHQLKQTGVDFTKAPPSPREIHIMNPWGTLYRDGVYFTENSHKGRGLFKLLDEIGFQPTRVLFINDKRDHIEEIEMVCSERKIPFTGLRYGFLDGEIASLDKKIVSIQSEHFGRILSEKAAKELINIAQEGT